MEAASGANCIKSDKVQTEISNSSCPSKLPLKKSHAFKKGAVCEMEANKQLPKNSQQAVVGLHKKPFKSNSQKQLPQIQKSLTAGSLEKHLIKKQRPILAKSISTISMNSLKISPRKLKSSTAVSEKNKTPRGTLAKTATGSYNLTSPTKANTVPSAKERVAEQKAFIVFEDLHKKMQNIQTEFMRKLEVMPHGFSSRHNAEYKLIAIAKNDQLKLVTKDEEVVGMPAKKLGNSTNNKDLKAKIDSLMVHNQKFLIKLMESALRDNFIANIGISPAEWQSDISRVAEKFRDTVKKQNSEQLEEILKDLEIDSSLAKACMSTEVNDKITNLHNEIEESSKSIQQYQSQINNLKKVNKEQFSILEKELATKNKLLEQKEADLIEIKKKLKLLEQQSNDKIAIEQSKQENFQADLKLNNKNVSKIKEQLCTLENQLDTEKNLRLCNEKKLKEKDLALSKTTRDLEELQLKEPTLLSGGDSTSLHAENMEIIFLKTTIDSLRKEKYCLERETDDLKIDVEKANSIIERQTAAENESKELIAELQAKIDDFTNKLAIQTAKIPADIENEVSNLRNSKAEKCREIENFRVELSKAQFYICQLEERVRCNQEMLLMNENSHRVHLSELFVQATEKSNNTVQLNVEVQKIKTGEFHSPKQFEELSRNEHMIRLLEKSNDRSQMMRVKQQEKIGQMEEEIARLKNTITLYQGARKGFLSASVSPPSEKYPDSTVEPHNTNLYYYTNERRRKRHVDIKVKKFEF